MIFKYQNRKTKLKKTCPLRFKPGPPVVTSRRLDHCTSAQQTNCSKSASILHITKAGTSPRFWPIEPGKYTSNCRENKAGTIPRYSWEKSMSRELRRVNISFLQLVMFPTIARNITRPANACYHSAGRLLFTHIWLRNHICTFPSAPTMTDSVSVRS